MPSVPRHGYHTHKFPEPISAAQLQHLKDSAHGLDVTFKTEKLGGGAGMVMAEVTSPSATTIDYLKYELDKLAQKQVKLIRGQSVTQEHEPIEE